MVSFQTPISPDQRRTIPSLEYEESSKKRRWEDQEAEENFKKHFKTSKGENTRPFLDMEIHLEERPLPLEWQRCLDIQSGKIHFYNTRTQKRTSKDPRQESPERLSPGNISLDLELNLSYADDNSTKRELNSHPISSDKPSKTSSSSTRSLSWVSFDADHQEMFAAVCMRCHMLVMLCKSSPACPSCKFMHPSKPKSSQPIQARE